MCSQSWCVCCRLFFIRGTDLQRERPQEMPSVETPTKTTINPRSQRFNLLSASSITQSQSDGNIKTLWVSTGQCFQTIRVKQARVREKNKVISAILKKYIVLAKNFIVFNYTFLVLLSLFVMMNVCIYKS